MISDHRKHLNRASWYGLAITALPWIVMILEWYSKSDWSRYGLYPRDWRSIYGIFTMPFLHADWPHLFSNSAPLLILSVALYYFFPQVATKVLLIGTLATGCLTWIIAERGWHIGASGVVYLLASFIFWSGVFKRHRPLMALSMLIIFLYGGLVWGLFPLQPDISWQGHLSGFISGLYLAVRYRNTPYAFEPEPVEEPEDPDEYPYWMENQENKMEE